jgi:hypothetical protein
MNAKAKSRTREGLRMECLIARRELPRRAKRKFTPESQLPVVSGS